MLPSSGGENYFDYSVVLPNFSFVQSMVAGSEILFCLRFPKQIVITFTTGRIITFSAKFYYIYDKISYYILG